MVLAAVLVIAVVAWMVFNWTLGGETEIDTGTTPLSETKPGP